MTRKLEKFFLVQKFVQHTNKVTSEQSENHHCVPVNRSTEETPITTCVERISAFTGQDFGPQRCVDSPRVGT